MSGSSPIRPQGGGPEGRTVRSGRAVRRRTGEPPRPRLPQPLLKVGLIAVFVLAAAWMFRAGGDSDSSAEEEEVKEANDLVVDLPAPSLRLVGEWSYVLNDEEVKEQDALEARLKADGDDAISRAMLAGLQQRLADRMTVTPTRITQVLAGQSTEWAWEAVRETESTVELILTTSSSSAQAVAGLEGMDWAGLRITGGGEAEGDVLEQRWHRVKEEKPAVSPPAAAETPGDPDERAAKEASSD